jgi:hypothetical protein
MQFTNWEEEGWKRAHPDLGERDYQAALNKLRLYWERLGFEQYAPTDIWCLSTAGQMPTVDDIAEGRYAEPRGKSQRVRHRHGKRP